MKEDRFLYQEKYKQTKHTLLFCQHSVSMFISFPFTVDSPKKPSKLPHGHPQLSHHQPRCVTGHQISSEGSQPLLLAWPAQPSNEEVSRCSNALIAHCSLGLPLRDKTPKKPRFLRGSKFPPCITGLRQPRVWLHRGQPAPRLGQETEGLVLLAGGLQNICSAKRCCGSCPSPPTGPSLPIRAQLCPHTAPTKKILN